MKSYIYYIRHFGIALVIVMTFSRCDSQHNDSPIRQSSPPAEAKVLMLTKNQIKLANITTEKVSMKSLGESLSVTGVLNTDKERSQVISSRVDGRIEKLYVKETGLRVVKGQPLYTLYSERLLTLQQEYLLAKEQFETIPGEVRYRSLVESAEKKLRLYGLTLDQVAQLTKSSIKSAITFMAPASGIVTKTGASEGGYVSEGSELFQIDDISKLWIEAELYPTETQLVKTGDKISVRINGDDTRVIEATINFLSPELRSNSQIVVLRASLDNRDNKYKAGQQVQVYLLHSTREGLAVPLDAVIRNGKGAHVYVTAGRGSFEPRVVRTGIETPDQIEITEGVSESDTVVVSGAYLLYSELVLKRGADPMALHHH